MYASLAVDPAGSSPSVSTLSVSANFPRLAALISQSTLSPGCAETVAVQAEASFTRQFTVTAGSWPHDSAGSSETKNFTGLSMRGTTTPSNGGRSGFAVRFTEFLNDGGVVLASLFLAPRLRQFASRYLKERARHRRGLNELDRLVDALVVWELERSEGQLPVD